MDTAKITVNTHITGVNIDKLLIRLHLLKMELYLKLVNTDHLDDTQKSNRTNVIGILKQYRQQNNFPTRDDGPSRLRLPRFVGSNNVPCAMGYILQNTDGMKLYEEISTNNNDVYVENIQSDEYDKWLLKNGMTKDETAAIQPGYPPATTTIYEIINPYLLWGATIAISSVILLYALLALNRFALKQPIKFVSTALITVVSFFLGSNITHFVLKNVSSDITETCVYSSGGIGFDGSYSPEECEDKIRPWTPSKTEIIPSDDNLIVD